MKCTGGLGAWRFDCPQADAGRLALLMTSRFGPAPHDGPYQAYWGWPTTSVSLAKRECSVVFATREGTRRMVELEREHIARSQKESDAAGALTGYGAGGGGKRSAGGGKGGG